MGPRQQSDGGTGVAGPVAKSSDTATVLVGQEFEIVEETVASGKARQSLGPALLLLEAMGKVDVCVTQSSFKRLAGFYPPPTAVGSTHCRLQAVPSGPE